MISNNILTIASGVKKKEDKNSGLKSILTLSQDLIEFQTNVEACIEEQVSDDFMDILEELDDKLVECNKKILDAAASKMERAKAERVTSKFTEQDIKESDVEEIEETEEVAEDDSFDWSADLKSRLEESSPEINTFNSGVSGVKAPKKPFSIK